MPDIGTPVTGSEKLIFFIIYKLKVSNIYPSTGHIWSNYQQREIYEQIRRVYQTGLVHS